jgi:hypothetical protein
VSKVTFTYTNGETSIPVFSEYAAELREHCGTQHLLTADGIPHCPGPTKNGEVLTVAPNTVISSALTAPGFSGPLVAITVVVVLLLLNLLPKGRNHARHY